jgi:hypothetical protein
VLHKKNFTLAYARFGNRWAVWLQPMYRHSEVDGNLVPFSRGVSVYRVNKEGLIEWGRDCVEASPPKPGDSTLALLQILLPILRRIGPERADPAKLTELPIASSAVWLFYFGATLAALPSNVAQYWIGELTSESVRSKDQSNLRSLGVFPTNVCCLSRAVSVLRRPTLRS